MKGHSGIECPFLLETLMLWQDSYVLYGEVHERHDYYNGQTAEFLVYESKTFTTVCRLCQKRHLARDSYDVVKLHLIHCSRQHGFVFPSAGWIFNVKDKQLQRLIQQCQDYELDFYGYSDHSGCIKQFILRPNGSQFIGCAVHTGNEIT